MRSVLARPHGWRRLEAVCATSTTLATGGEHDIVVEEVFPAEPGVPYRRCVTGRRACPRRTAGPPGYADLREAIADPDHPEREAFLEWIGAGFDPEAVNSWLKP